MAVTWKKKIKEKNSRSINRKQKLLKKALTNKNSIESTYGGDNRCMQMNNAANVGPSFVNGRMKNVTGFVYTQRRGTGVQNISVEINFN